MDSIFPLFKCTKSVVEPGRPISIVVTGMTINGDLTASMIPYRGIHHNVSSFNRPAHEGTAIEDVVLRLTYTGVSLFSKEDETKPLVSFYILPPEAGMRDVKVGRNTYTIFLQTMLQIDASGFTFWLVNGRRAIGLPQESRLSVRISGPEGELIGDLTLGTKKLPSDDRVGGVLSKRSRDSWSENNSSITSPDSSCGEVVVCTKHQRVDNNAEEAVEGLERLGSRDEITAGPLRGPSWNYTCVRISTPQEYGTPVFVMDGNHMLRAFATEMDRSCTLHFINLPPRGSDGPLSRSILVSYPLQGTCRTFKFEYDTETGEVEAEEVAVSRLKSFKTSNRTVLSTSSCRMDTSFRVGVHFQLSIRHRRQLMSNGIISSYDVTKVILHTALEIESPDTKRKQFAILRMMCKLWKDIVDSFTDCLIRGDLFLAVKGGKMESLRFLLTRAELDSSSRDIGLLYSASTGESTEIARLLLPRMDVSTHSTIGAAAICGRTSTVQLLLSDSRMDPSAQNNEAIIKAAHGGHSETVRLLLSDSRVDPSAQDNEAIKLAARYGHTEAVRLLMSDSRVDPSAQNNSAVTQAAPRGHTETVRLLLSDSRVDPSAQNDIAMINAVCGGHTEIVGLLMSDSRVDPSAYDNSCVISAAGGGHIETVRLLLSDSRVDPSAQNNEAIVLAANRGHNEIVRLLLPHPRIQSNKAVTRAAEGGFLPTVRFLRAEDF
ncbi:putative ankyrin repeat protein [Planoprotostelium fungivorum]|uniref:Putative ankyrin repeat protein n=1 Tax=Planoprotostelium fungivorum TaxID=1890364 RepID=A0A2P6MWV2_9EUKA|nr:putative ankyrin repeat protein [Planoprotostelium fungivorum]